MSFRHKRSIAEMISVRLVCALTTDPIQGSSASQPPSKNQLAWYITFALTYIPQLTKVVCHHVELKAR